MAGVPLLSIENEVALVQTYNKPTQANFFG